MIEDTSKREPLLHMLGSMSEGSSDYITGMEAAGQAQLVHSELLPIQLRGGDKAAFEALGFVFGETVDDLFRKATLPAGWTKVATDHSMWSKVLDELGRERVSVFYKAAFYDRDAFMRLATVYSYAGQILYSKKRVKPIFDDTWCTRQAWAEAVAGLRTDKAEMLAHYEARPVPSDYDRERAAELRRDVKRLDELAALA